jgi:hypothetical protein
MHIKNMTQLLDKAFERARALAPQAQDDLARVVLQLAGDAQSVEQISADEEASFGKSIAQAEAGDFASDEEVQAIWSKHGF